MFTKEQIKNTGATFTPKELASYLSAKLISYLNEKDVNILDPACGGGELLVAIGEKLLSKNTKFRLTGYDENEHYLKIAEDRILKYGKATSNLIREDFLQTITNKQNRYKPKVVASTTSSLSNSFDIVIANPPYVRTQVLGTDKARALSKKFNLKGRVDLYYPFIIAMTESLKEGGLLGVITSNRYLSTKSGNPVRKYLSENFEILELIDLGDTKLFDAAVLPAIFIGRKRKMDALSSPAKFIKIYEGLNGYNGPYIAVDTLYDVLTSMHTGYFLADSKRYKKTEGILNYKVSSEKPWEMLSEIEASWIDRIEKHAKHRVGDFFNVKVGIKTTADKVFISDKWDSLGEAKPEAELLKELISQENIEAWGSTENLKLKVLYTHYTRNGIKYPINLDDYPKAKQYLINHKAQLESRKYVVEAGRQWFEIWVTQKPELWPLPKLVFPDISLTPRFYFDKDEKIVNGNCYWIVAQQEEDIDKLLLIQGVANTKLMTKYHDLVFSNKLYFGRRRYVSQYVERYPLPDFSSPLTREIIMLAKKLNEVRDAENMTKLSHQLEIKVAEAFGVDPVFTLH